MQRHSDFIITLFGNEIPLKLHNAILIKKYGQKCKCLDSVNLNSVNHAVGLHMCKIFSYMYSLFTTAKHAYPSRPQRPSARHTPK